MALASPSLFVILALFLASSLVPNLVLSQQQSVLNSDEQEAAYRVLESVNSAVPWRTLFPDDLCYSAPHGVACGYFADDDGGVETPHITELSFGYVSDYSPNPPCTPNSTMSPLIFRFKYLRKLFFYKCFEGAPVTIPPVSPEFGSFLEELVLVENPSLVGPASGIFGNFTRLRRVVVTGNGVYGKIPDGFGGLMEFEQITLSRNRLTGELPHGLGNLKKLKVLDLSYNGFEGNVPDSIGRLTRLLKLDLSSNNFNGKLPENLKYLQSLEFLDLSYNRFANFGVPIFLAEMPSLRELYLSGNKLGGQIPEIWDNLRGILRLGFSGMGLVGNIPASMGVFLTNLCYLGLDNNMLEGSVPQELAFLESVSELNLENNKLSGRLPFSTKFSAKIGQKLKIGGNPQLCVDENSSSTKNSSNLGQLKLCSKPHMPNPALFSGGSSMLQASLLLIFLGFCSSLLNY